MLTKEQEEFLADFADKGIAEKAAIDIRNAEIDLDTKIRTAREAKKAELEMQAEELIQAGLDDFETNEAPKIK